MKLSLALFVFSFQAVSQNCAKQTVRKEVHDMTPEEIQIFKDTIRQAINTPDTRNPNTNIWQFAANAHNQLNLRIHGGASFFYWHRMFLVYMERRLQSSSNYVH